MKSLNELYDKSCKPKCENYKQILSHITLIDNFFEDFDEARDFFINREKWKCIPYQEHSKPGCESLFPSWVGKSLMEKYILDNKISDDINSYNMVCNFFYYKNSELSSLSNSGYFPHVDDVKNNNILQYICLINLNNISVSTNFYTYKNKDHCDNKLLNEWDDYNKDLNNKLLNYFDKKIITRDKVKLFLKTQKHHVKLIKTLEYKPNQAIVYPANIFHSPNITQEFTEDNPRVLLRISFDRKIIKPKSISYG